MGERETSNKQLLVINNGIFLPVIKILLLFFFLNIFCYYGILQYLVPGTVPYQYFVIFSFFEIKHVVQYRYGTTILKKKNSPRHKKLFDYKIILSQLCT